MPPIADRGVTAINRQTTTVTESPPALADIVKKETPAMNSRDDYNYDYEVQSSETGTDESLVLTTVSNFRGYHIMVIVLCCLVLASIAMCYLTWRLRYKIVLRVVIYLIHFNLLIIISTSINSILSFAAN